MLIYFEWRDTENKQYFGIQFTDYSVDIDDVREAVEEEMNGPGSLLGYRALHQKIREVHGLSVPRNLVYAMMTEVNPQGLEVLENLKGYKERMRLYQT